MARERDPEDAIYFDVDDTLVMWPPHVGNDDDLVTFYTPHGRKPMMLFPHKRHIALLKKSWEHGRTVVVWSAGGELWAREVITKLDLLDKVHFILSKPTCYVDDLTSPGDILWNRRYDAYEPELEKK